jgi:uncharacterized membrane protein
MSVTVVSGYFPLAKSRHTVEKYRRWISFFCQVDMQCIVYTSAPDIFAPLESRANAKVVRVELSSLQVASPEWMRMWRKTHDVNREKHIHSPELYAVWAAKQELVMKAIEWNPFSSDYFVWMDAGIVRNDDIKGLLGQQPFSRVG